MLLDFKDRHSPLMNFCIVTEMINHNTHVFQGFKHNSTITNTRKPLNQKGALDSSQFHTELVAGYESDISKQP